MPPNQSKAPQLHLRSACNVREICSEVNLALALGQEIYTSFQEEVAREGDTRHVGQFDSLSELWLRVGRRSQVSPPGMVPAPRRVRRIPGVRAPQARRVGFVLGGLL